MLARNERSTTHLHVISQEASTPPGPDSSEVFRVSGKEGKKWQVARHQPYESGSVTPNAIKIAMRAKQTPVSRSVSILGMKSMK